MPCSADKAAVALHAVRCPDCGAFLAVPARYPCPGAPGGATLGIAAIVDALAGHVADHPACIVATARLGALVRRYRPLALAPRATR